MKKWALITATGLLSGLSLFASCSKSDQEPEPEKSKEELWYWGYFRGTVNNESFSVVNEDIADRPVYSIRQGIHIVQEGEVASDSVNILSTSIVYDKNTVAHIHLYKLNPGVRYMAMFAQLEWNSNFINVKKYTDSTFENTKRNYIPKEENPFRVEITGVSWSSSIHPIVEAKLNGVLYEENNPKDSLVINAVYGTR